VFFFQNTYSLLQIVTPHYVFMIQSAEFLKPNMWEFIILFVIWLQWLTLFSRGHLLVFTLEHAACYARRWGGLNIVGSGFRSSEIWNRVTDYPVPDVSRQHKAFISKVGNLDRLTRTFIPLKVRTLHCIETSVSDYPLTEPLVPK